MSCIWGLLAAIIAIASIWTCWVAFAPARGRAAARADVAKGYFEVKTWGYPSPWYLDYARLLRQRYGVNVSAIGGCTIGPPKTSFANGYNEVSMAALNQKFGHDIFAECETAAVTTWQQNHP